MSFLGYHECCERQPAGLTERQLAGEELPPTFMRQIFDDTEGNDRAPLMHKALRHADRVVNRKEGDYLTRRHAMAERIRRRQLRDTFPGREGYPIHHIIGPRFASGEHDLERRQGITHIPTGEGRL